MASPPTIHLQSNEMANTSKEVFILFLVSCIASCDVTIKQSVPTDYKYKYWYLWLHVSYLELLKTKYLNAVAEVYIKSIKLRLNSAGYNFIYVASVPTYNVEGK
jgi:hypothetical protein